MDLAASSILELDFQGSDAYYLASNRVITTLPKDTTPPELLYFWKNYAYRNEARMEIYVRDVATIYYMYGLKGTIQPTFE